MDVHTTNQLSFITTENPFQEHPILNDPLNLNTELIELDSNDEANVHIDDDELEIDQ